MKRRQLLYLITFCVFSNEALTAEQKLDDTQITELLSGKLVKSDVDHSYWTQYFSRDGSTEYSSGSSPSIGYWKAQGSQYCSVWPPVTQWTCYDVLSTIIENGRIRIIWVSEEGTRTTGVVEQD